MASFLYLEPLVTLGAAIVLLGEEAGSITLLGGALLFLGVFLVQGAGGGEGGAGSLAKRGPDVARRERALTWTDM